MTKNGDVVSVPGEAGMPCQCCLETEQQLQLRYYRRVLGLLIMDRVWGEAGYFCGPCRRRHFAKNMAFTLVFGWWGVIAMVFRNPYAILVNLWALFRPPFGAGEFGAMNADEIRQAAAREQQREQRLADVYMRMPGWMETLTEDDITRVLANVDYYATLDVSRSASHREIKAAWRAQVKAHHPDRVGATGHERIVAINDAWQVLGDERLRHAYDHREELLGFLHETEAVASEFDEQDADEDMAMVVGCVECRLAFESFDDAADHVDAVHPHVDYHDILVSLLDDEDAEPERDRASNSPRWRCKACPRTFSDYDLAVQHADHAHPERVTVDPRAAVEAI
ncbi:MAG: J domain-containing protein [Solirubrobacteraceae bacterium]